MKNEARPGWRQYARDSLRPEAKTAPPSRRAAYADAALAVTLSVLAVLAGWKLQSGEQFIGLHPSGTGAPSSAGPLSSSDVPQVPRGGRPLYLLVALHPLPLAVRRRYPLLAFAAVMGTGLAVGGQATWVTIAICCIAAYSAIVHSRYRVPATAALLIAAVLAGLAFQNAAPSLPGWSAGSVILLLAAVVASAVRYWQNQLRASQLRVVALQREQEEATRRAVAEERSRITAELHDVVTHNVSVMVIQAGAARTVMDVAPEESKRALLAVEAGGRAAMSELRAVMSLLAPSETDEDALQPQPGLDRLDALVERVRSAGMPVDLVVSLPAQPLSSGVELAAYRVVQEAMTNALKHAVGAKASVRLDHDDTWLEMEISNTPGTAGAQAATGNGRGLIGLRERLAVYGGSLATHRLEDGGFRLAARLPWRAAG
ncbi:sensor histidine kinase [Streptomyces sp. MUM 16J]|uniref:sensor histidine kinase n=1 Tax=Streptomyces sp. MUM 16J TaxID=2791988 RepID=UPI001F048EAB|nr:histidine kinase [Streptomyces sp. MUM 16J]MCH0561188.1 two-component sensor histidine kinase [Streptomyces sp. MUM 16J]